MAWTGLVKIEWVAASPFWEAIPSSWLDAASGSGKGADGGVGLGVGSGVG